MGKRPKKDKREKVIEKQHDLEERVKTLLRNTFHLTKAKLICKGSLNNPRDAPYILLVGYTPNRMYNAIMDDLCNELKKQFTDIESYVVEQSEGDRYTVRLQCYNNELHDFEPEKKLRQRILLSIRKTLEKYAM